LSFAVGAGGRILACALVIKAQAGCGVACLCLLYCNEKRFYSDGSPLSQQRKPFFAAAEIVFCSNGNHSLQQRKLSFAATETILCNHDKPLLQL